MTAALDTASGICVCVPSLLLDGVWILGIDLAAISAAMYFVFVDALVDKSSKVGRNAV